MKTKYPLKEGCLPSPGAALAANVLPEWFQRNDITVKLDSGNDFKTCHLVADGRKFNIHSVYGCSSDWEYTYITQFSYLDATGEIQFVDVTPRHPHPIEKGNGTTHFGYVTKINDKRWGVMVELNWSTGIMSIVADNGTPIVGVLIQLI